MPRYQCLACNKIIASEKSLNNHYIKKSHKLNVIKCFPDTIVKKNINGIPIITNRLDLKKRKEYIKIINNNKNKIKIKNDKEKEKENSIIIPTYEMYQNEYYDLTSVEMSKLINIVIKFIKYKNKKLEDWFDHEDYINDKNNNNIIVDTYCEIRDIILDNDLYNELIS